jgi:hypothetical protein
MGSARQPPADKLAGAACSPSTGGLSKLEKAGSTVSRAVNGWLLGRAHFRAALVQLCAAAVPRILRAVDCGFAGAARIASGRRAVPIQRHACGASNKGREGTRFRDTGPARLPPVVKIKDTVAAEWYADA